MHDDSTLRQPAILNKPAKGKCMYPNLGQPPKINSLLR